MSLLLDTHALIWFLTNDKRLPVPIKAVIEDEVNNCWVSIASLWEMGIKHSLGKLELSVSLDQIFGLILKSGIDILPITMEHILKNSSLDYKHRDPFDRIIIAQGMVERLSLVSKDEAFQSYDVQTIWK